MSCRPSILAHLSQSCWDRWMSVVRRAPSTLLQWSSLCIFTILGKNDAYMTLCNNHVLCVASSSGHYQVCSSYAPTQRDKNKTHPSLYEI